MSAVLWLLFVGFVRAQLPSGAQQNAAYISYDQLYESGVNAYDQQLWFECSSLMHRAISARRAYWDGVVECRSQCAGLHPLLDMGWCILQNANCRILKMCTLWNIRCGMLCKICNYV